MIVLRRFEITLIFQMPPLTGLGRMIPPDAQRAMSKRTGSHVTEIKGSHAIYLSQPHALATMIAQAASGAAMTAR